MYIYICAIKIILVVHFFIATKENQNQAKDTKFEEQTNKISIWSFLELNVIFIL